MDKSAGITWSVELPQKQNTALGRRRPRARLSIGESETIEVPKAVGSKLKRLEKDGRHFASRAELLYNVKEISRACAHDRMEQLVNFREYSSAELSRKLLDDGYLPDLVDHIIGRAQEVGVISDTRFAESFVRSKLAAGWGRQRITQELGRRGIDDDTIESLNEVFPLPEVEVERAYDIAQRKRLTGTNDFQKIVRHLVSRGFSYSVASTVARRIIDESRDEM